jgi:selT/selW/selH-like putative selenoprotein
VGLAEHLLDRFQPDLSVLITPGSNGIFEVSLNSRRLYSNQNTGTFPKHEEIVKAIQRAGR